MRDRCPDVVRTLSQTDKNHHLEAFCIAYPEEACNILPFSKDDLIAVIRNNPWFSIYKADEKDIIRRLR